MEKILKFNRIGAPGWWWNGRILRRKTVRVLADQTVEYTIAGGAAHRPVSALSALVVDHDSASGRTGAGKRGKGVGADTPARTRQLARSAFKRTSAVAKKIERQLLISELDGNGQMHGSRLPIEHGGRIFPLLDGIESSLMEKRRPRKNLDGCDVAGSIDECVDLNLAGKMLSLGDGRILGWNRLEELSLLHFATNRERSGRRVMATGRSSQRIPITRNSLGVNRL